MNRAYRVVVWMDEVGNPESCELQKQETDGLRTIVKWIAGPFDVPEEMIMVAREMIEHAGYQAQLVSDPGSPS